MYFRIVLMAGYYLRYNVRIMYQEFRTLQRTALLFSRQLCATVSRETRGAREMPGREALGIVSRA